MQFALLILFTTQSAQQTQDADFFSPPLLLQDRCERSWHRAALPASLTRMRTRDRLAASGFPFKGKTQASALARASLILKPLPSRASLAPCAHFDAPPASTPNAVAAASAAVAAAPHRRGLPAETRPALAEEGNFKHEEGDSGRGRGARM